MKTSTILFLLITIFALFACRKEAFITSPDARLIVDSDTLTFDTVFTSAGSIMQYFTIVNDNNQKLRLDEVTLAGGNNSNFKMNVDGLAGSSFNNIEIERNDSIYVFVSVNVDPSSDDLPFVINDSIRIVWNGNRIYKQLQAWGQNANFFRNRRVTTDTTWTNDRPFVILGGITVGENATLTIQPGVRIYHHADAPFIIDGTLKVNGTKSDSIVFAGDRIDPDYRDLPGSWPGLYFRGMSHDNELTYAIIKNAYQGVIAVEPPANTNPKVSLHQCIIDNIYDIGILGVSTSIAADNCLISNCGNNVTIVYGGAYDFTHCTMVTYSSAFIDHKNPVLYISNSIKQGDQLYIADLDAVFRNSIVWGEGGFVENEVVVKKDGAGYFNLDLDHVLYKAKDDPLNTNINASIKNEDPAFDTVNVSHRLFNFRLRPESPALNKGLITSFPYDLDGNPRNANIPDLGCYEKQ